jgi:hypothetical protein
VHVVVDRLGELLAEGARVGDEAGRNVLGQSAGLAVAAVNANSGDHLEQIQHSLALIEAVHVHRLDAELEAHRAHPDEVRVDAVQLGQRRPDPDRLGRHIDREQLLDREHEQKLVLEAGEVVDPARVVDRLPPALLLHALLKAGVQVADDRPHAHDLLTVEIDDEAQDSVR